MKIETREVYKCEFCNKLYQIKGYCEKHEVVCTHNPNNQRDCFNCGYIEKRKHTIYFDTGYGESKRVVEILYCDKIKSFLYPPKVEHKGNAYELGDELNDPMPMNCEFRNSDITND